MSNPKPPPIVVVRVQLKRPMHFQVLGKVCSSIDINEQGVVLFRTQYGITVRHDHDPECWETIPPGNIGLVKEAYAEGYKPADSGVPKKKQVPNTSSSLRGLPDTRTTADVRASGPLQSGTFRKTSRKDTPWTRRGPPSGE